VSGAELGPTPVMFSLVDDAGLERRLLLFVAFVVRPLAEYASQ
jgi:hypothetical protein